MLPQLLFGPVPYESPVSLPEYTRDGAGAVFDELIQNITNASQVVVNKENNTVDEMPDVLQRGADSGESGVTSASGVLLQSSLLNVAPADNELAASPAIPVPNQQTQLSAPAISDPVVGSSLPFVETLPQGSVTGVGRLGVSDDVAGLPGNDRMAIGLTTTAALDSADRLRGRQSPSPHQPLPAVASTAAGSSPAPSGEMLRTGSIASILSQVGSPDSSMSEAIDTNRQSGLTVPATSATTAAELAGDRGPNDSTVRAEPLRVQVLASTVPGSGEEAAGSTVNKAMNAENPTNPVFRHAGEAGNRVSASQRGYLDLPAQSQSQVPIVSPQSTASDPLPAGSALIATSTHVADQRSVARSSLAARLANLSQTAGTSIGDIVVKPETPPAVSLPPLTQPAPQAAIGTESVFKRIQPTTASTQREHALVETVSERRVGDVAGPSMTLGTEPARAESVLLRSESSGTSAQIPAQLARHILHSHAQNLSELRLQLKPEELGQLELKLRVDGDRVHVAVVTQQPGVRELVESQLPALRSLLQEGGFQLGDVDVRQHGGESGDQPAGQTPDGGKAVADLSDETKAAAGPDDRGHSSGLIDAFV